MKNKYQIGWFLEEVNLSNIFISILLFATITSVQAGISPSNITGISIAESGTDLVLSWSAVATDIYGSPQTIDHYNVYRDITPGFVPDFAGGTNRIGQPVINTYTDVGAISSTDSYYYAITAVTAIGDESLVVSDVAYKIRQNLIYDANTRNRHWLSLPVTTLSNTPSRTVRKKTFSETPVPNKRMHIL